MPSLRSHEGELVIDNRAGPGVDAAFIRASGKTDIPIVGEGQFFESAITSCSHCGAIVVLNPDRTRPRGYCAKCDHYVCDSCVGECRPFAKLIEDLHNQAYHLGVRGLTLDQSGLLVPQTLRR